MNNLSIPADNSGKKSSYSTLAFTSLGHFMNDGFTFIFPVIADILASVNGYSPTLLTILFAAFYSSSTVFGILAGRFSDRGSALGGIHTGIILISLGVAGFSFTLLGQGLSYAVSLASSVVMGMGTGFYHPIGAALLQRSYSRNNIGKVLGVNGSMGSIGRAVFPSLFLGMAYFMSQGDALAVLAFAGMLSAVAIGLGLRRRAETGTRSGKKGDFRAAVNASIIVLTAVFFIKSVSAQGMVAWIPTFLTYGKGVQIGATLGLVLTIMYSSAIIGQPLFGILVDRIDKRLLLTVSSLGTAGTMFAYMITSGWIEMAMLSLFGFFTFSGFPLTMSLVSDYAPKGGSSLTNSIVWGFGNSGGTILGPIVAGAIILNNYSRIPISFNVMIVLSIIVAFAALALPGTEKKGKMPMFG